MAGGTARRQKVIEEKAQQKPIEQRVRSNSLPDPASFFHPWNIRNKRPVNPLQDKIVICYYIRYSVQLVRIIIAGYDYYHLVNYLTYDLSFAGRMVLIRQQKRMIVLFCFKADLN